MAMKRFFRTAQIELNLYATLEEVTQINASQIAQFKTAYWAHTDTRLDIRDSLSDAWIQTVAQTTAAAKTQLRTLLRHSQYWNENIQACELPIIREWKADSDKAYDLIRETWEASYNFWHNEQLIPYERRYHFYNAMRWLSRADADGAHPDFEAIQILTPRKFWRKKKMSIFVALKKSCLPPKRLLKYPGIVRISSCLRAYLISL